VDEERSTQGEHFAEDVATSGASDSGKDPAAEAIGMLKALPSDTVMNVLTEVLQERPHAEATKEIATKVVGSLPADATEAKKEVATSAVESLPDDATEAKKEIAVKAVHAASGAQAKKEVAASAVEALPAGATEAKKEIATKVVGSLPADATEAKKEIVKESVRDVSPEFRDYLIADLVTMRRLFKRVFVWTIFGAVVVALVVAVFAAGTAFWGSEQAQNLLWVVIPVTTLLLGYGFGRRYSEKADINHLREQNPEE
jgi:hypothetical protein